MRDLVKYAVIGFFIGILISSGILAIQMMSPDLMAEIMSINMAGDVVLAVWPSSIILMGADADTSAVIPVASVLVNGFMYGLIVLVACLVWSGISGRVREGLNKSASV